MSYFDQMVAAGSATCKTVELCLQAQKTASLSSSDIDTRDNMRRSGAGKRVARWFATTSDDNKAAFLRSGLIRLAAPFVLVEDLRNVLWQWMMTPLEFNMASTVDVIVMQRVVLTEYLRAETEYGTGVSGAIDIYLEATDHSSMFRTSSDTTTRSPLSAGGLFLSRIIVQSKRKNFLPQFLVEQFEAFSTQMEKWCQTSTSWKAALRLCHPNGPDPSLALQYIRSLEPLPLKKGSEQFRKHQLALCLDTAQVLLNQDRYSDANFVLDFVKESFLKDEVEQHAKKQRSSAQDVVNAAMLEKLDLGYS
jgi:hypothetical protein